jgi:hypothetical protein
MISIASGVRVWIATGRTDMRLRDECRACDRILSGRIIRAPSLAPTQQKLT